MGCSVTIAIIRWEMKKTALMIAALLPFLGGAAHASTSASGQVTAFATLGTNIILVFTNGTRGTPPSCSNSGFPTRWAFAIDTALGQAMLSILMTAKATGDTVTLYGTGSCSVLGDSETIGSVVTNNAQ